MDQHQQTENASIPLRLPALVVQGFVYVVKLLAAAAIAFSLLGFIARWWWPLELMCHFRMQYAWALSLAAVVLWSARSFRWASIATVVALLNAALLIPCFWPARYAEAEDRDVLRVLTANVHTANQQADRFLALVEAESPDVIVVMEVDDRWIDALAPLRSDYPFTRLEPRQSNFGMALYCKSPLQSIETFDLGGIDTPAIRATIETANGDLSLLAIHPLPPMRAEMSRLRNSQMQQAADLALENGGPILVVGDFNATRWSPAFGDLVRNAQLHDASDGRGILPTWPVQFPWLLRLPIDHALVSQGVAVHNFRTLEDIGSDHLPICIDISLQPVRQ